MVPESGTRTKPGVPGPPMEKPSLRRDEVWGPNRDSLAGQRPPVAVLGLGEGVGREAGDEGHGATV